LGQLGKFHPGIKGLVEGTPDPKWLNWGNFPEERTFLGGKNFNGKNLRCPNSLG